jgi:thiamine biosynthesis lipoprotein
VFLHMRTVKIFLKRIFCLLLTFAMPLGLCACEVRKEVEEKTRFSDVIYGTFDTAVSVTAYCKTREEFNELFGEIKEEFEEYHKLYDIYNNYNGIVNAKTINDNAGKEPLKVDAMLIALLQYAKELYTETDGNMNIAMGAVLKIWHCAREYAVLYPDKAYVPEMGALKEAAKHCSIDDLIIDAGACTVRLADPEMSIDLGSIAKGFATECVARKLMAEGKDNILISAGGNTRTIGVKPDGAPWVVAIQNPSKDEKNPYSEKLNIESNSVVSSGSYERYYEVGGVRYHHIINKDTLMPRNDYQSVTIVSESSAYADALSTAVFNMDLESGKAFFAANDKAEAMWILASGEKVYSDGFLSFIK